MDPVGDAAEEGLAHVEARSQLFHFKKRLGVVGGVLDMGLAHLPCGGAVHHHHRRAPRQGLAGEAAQARHGGQERAGIGVLRGGEDVAHPGLLHLLALPHHHHVVGHLGHHAHVVGDEDHGGAHLGLQVADDVEDLRLDGHVERRGGLVGDEQFGVAGQRHGDHHPLAHAAGELVRIAVEELLRIGQAHLAQQLPRPQARVARAQAFVQGERFGDLVADGEDRIEGGHRLLEDHGDVVAANGPEPVVRRAHEIERLPRGGPEQHLPAGDPSAGVVGEPHDRQRRDGFPRAGLAHHRQGLSRLHVEAHVLDGPQGALPAAELHRQAADGQERFIVNGQAGWCVRHQSILKGRRGRMREGSTPISSSGSGS
jgi:hypothetical protein